MARASTRSRNPALSTDEAMVVFRELVAQADPVSLTVALDALEEAGLSVVDASIAWFERDEGRIARRHSLSTKGDVGARGWFVWGDVGDVTDCVWSVERDYGSGAGQNWRVLLMGHFHDRPWFYEVGRRYKDVESAIDRAITDAWFCVNVMKYRYIATGKRIRQVTEIIEAGGHGDYDEYTIDKMQAATTLVGRKSLSTPPSENPRKKSARGPAPPGIFGFAGDLLGSAVNPAMSREDAIMAFRDLIRDPDPSAMQIAEDLALQHKIGLAELSSGGHRAGQSSGSFTLSPLHPADAPLYRVDWVVEPVYPSSGPYAYTSYSGSRAKVHYAIGIQYFWNAGRGFQLPMPQTIVTPSGAGRYMTTLNGAVRTAAADAWAVAKRMKELMGEGREDVDARPRFTTQDPGTTIHEQLMEAYVAPDKTAPELYEHRAVRKGRKIPTFLEARDDIMAALERAGWELSLPSLKTPYATSPNKRLRLWFKPQAVHYTLGTNHAQGNARAISYDMDIRRMTPTEFLDEVKRKYGGGF